MFICEKCLEEKYTNFAIPISYGKCEDCGKGGVCADVPSGNLNYKPEYKKEKQEVPGLSNEVLNLIIRKKTIWAEVKAKEQEYGRIQKQVDELEQAKKDISFEIQKKVNDAQKIADKLLAIEYEGLKLANK